MLNTRRRYMFTFDLRMSVELLLFFCLVCVLWFVEQKKIAAICRLAIAYEPIAMQRNLTRTEETRATPSNEPEKRATWRKCQRKRLQKNPHVHSHTIAIHWQSARIRQSNALWYKCVYGGFMICNGKEIK